MLFSLLEPELSAERLSFSFSFLKGIKGFIHFVKTQNYVKNLLTYQGVRNISFLQNFAYVLNE